MINAQTIDWPSADAPEREFAALRQKQLELAREGKFEESAIFAEEARQVEEQLPVTRN